ncbi:MAG: TIGR04206 family protein [Haloferacaceae archaeon]
MSSARRAAALLALAAVPWSIQRFAAGGVTLLFPWGLVTTRPPTVTTLYEFLFVYTTGLPEFILAWPLSVGLYALALASGAAGLLVGREDPRVTGGLLVAAGIAQVTVASGFSVQPGRAAYPVGTAALWAVAWRVYWPAVRADRAGAVGTEAGATDEE